MRLGAALGEGLPLVERMGEVEREGDTLPVREGAPEGDMEAEGDTVAEHVGWAPRPSIWQDTGQLQGVGAMAPAGQKEPRGHVMGAADAEGQKKPAAQMPHVSRPMRLPGL
jgi:hypothetical protein